MTTYEPGTVAVATVHGVGKEVMVFRREREGGNDWSSIRAVCGWLAHGDRDVTDVRPLVVLDLDDPEGTLQVLGAAAIEFDNDHMSASLRRIDSLREQIREQTRARKPPEPTGLGAVVKDRDGTRWVRIASRTGDTKASWECDNSEPMRADRFYADIDAVEVLSLGLVT